MPFTSPPTLTLPTNSKGPESKTWRPRGIFWCARILRTVATAVSSLSNRIHLLKILFAILNGDPRTGLRAESCAWQLRNFSGTPSLLVGEMEWRERPILREAKQQSFSPGNVNYRMKIPDFSSKVERSAGSGASDSGPRQELFFLAAAATLAFTSPPHPPTLPCSEPSVFYSPSRLPPT